MKDLVLDIKFNGKWLIISKLLRREDAVAFFISLL